MADDKTSKVFVRLVKGFPAGVTHRRGGVALTAGPVAVEAEVTDEQRKALIEDPSVEFVSAKDAQKVSEATADVESVAGQNEPTGRNYEGTAEAPKAKADKKA